LRNYTGLTHGEKASYACADGYVNLTGDDDRTCSDGVWSGTSPTCSPEMTGNLFNKYNICLN